MAHGSERMKKQTGNDFPGHLLRQRLLSPTETMFWPSGESTVVFRPRWNRRIWPMDLPLAPTHLSIGGRVTAVAIVSFLPSAPTRAPNSQPPELREETCQVTILNESLASRDIPNP